MSELQEAINEMRNMRESYDQLGAAAEAYNTGKTELAANITSKGVQASATETLPELAAKVRDIQQEQTILQGGDVYAQQLFGDADPTVSPLWNLYDVLAQMKSQYMGAGHYAALIVCEYYKGYDSLQLQGADAYYTCDGDFYDVLSPLHTWHDSDNGKANRWVCFLFVTEGARLDITNTAISPRSMYIGGHIGTIEYFVNGRLTEFVCGVEETDVVDNFLNQGKTQNFGRNCVLRNVKNFIVAGGSGALKVGSQGALVIDNMAEDCNAQQLSFIETGASYVEVRGLKRLTHGVSAIKAQSAVVISAPDIEEWSSSNGFIYEGAPLEMVYMPKLKKSNDRLLGYGTSAGYGVKLSDVVVGAMETNMFYWTWDPTTILADATKKAQLIDNVKNHILARVSDRTGITQLVFTISKNMYNNIASEQIEWHGETMSLADAFLTKNWLLAGA